MSSHTDPGPSVSGRAEPPELPRHSGTIAKRVAGKAFPLYLSMLSTLIGTAVTAAVLGNTGTLQLAAYALVISVFSPVIMVVYGTLRGSMPFFTENESSPHTLAPVLRDSLWLGLFLGLAGGALIVAVPALARLIGVAEPTVAELGWYPLLMAGYVICTSVKNAVTVLLVSLGHSRVVLVLSLVGVLMNVTLTPALVLGLGPFPRLGLMGAGVSMCALGLTILVLDLLVVRRFTILRGHGIGFGLPRWAGIGQIAKVGLPTGSTLLIKTGTLTALALVVARVGPEEAAVHQLMVVLMNLAFISFIAVGQATIPFTVRAAKAGERPLVLRTVRASYLVSLPVMLVSAAVVWWAADPVVGLFTDDPRVHTAVIALIPLLCLVGLLDALQSAPNMGMLGLKDTRPALYAFAACFGLLVLVAVPVMEMGGLPALWSAYAAATGALVLLQWISFIRMSRKVGREPSGPNAQARPGSEVKAEGSGRG